MATTQAMRTIVLDASGDMSAQQFMVMKLHTTARQVIVAGNLTDHPIGILQNKPTAAGQQAIIALLDGAILKMIAGEAVTAGAFVGLHATDGKVGAPGDAGGVYVGVAVEAAAADGDIFEVCSIAYRAHA